MGITHTFVSGKADGADATLVQPSNWNASHTFDGQLAFPATQSASADPNTLDDYEEGTWTPTIKGSTSGTHSGYSTQVGTYTKIGRQVTEHFYLRPSGALSGPVGNVWIGGSGFTASSANVGNAGCPSFYQTITMTASHTQLMFQKITSQTDIEVNTSGSGLSYANQAVSGYGAAGILAGTIICNV